MVEITKEQILKLERIGIAVADSILDEFNSLKTKSDENKKSMNIIYMEFEKIIGNINEEEAKNEN